MDICERIYKGFFGLKSDSFKKCEVPWCGKKYEHIHALSDKTVIEDLIGLCSEHKIKYRNNKFWTLWLKVIHLHNIINHKKNKTC